MKMIKILKKCAYPAFFHLTLLLLVVISVALNNNLDFDLWARLINGRHVVQTGLPCFEDILSYIPRHTWYDPEWLSSAFIYIIQSKFGLDGLNILNFTSGYLVILTLFYAIKNVYKNVLSPYFILFYVFVIFVLAYSIYGGLRCQVVTYILVSIWVLLLEKIRKGNNKLLFLLPVIMLFWLNTHGGCIAGVGILFLYMLGEALNKKDWKKYLYALIPTCLVFLINPWGFDYIEFMINSALVNRDGISEWEPLFDNLKNGQLYHFFCFMLFSVCVYITRMKIEKLEWGDIDKTKLLNILVLVYISFSHIKHIPLFLLVVGILTYGDMVYCLELIWNKIVQKFRIMPDRKKEFIFYSRCLIYFVLYLYILLKLILSPFSFVAKSNIPNFYPIYPVHFLQVNELKGTLFAEFGISSFLGYKLYPNIKVMYDGREEQVYPYDMFEHINNFLDWKGNNPLYIVKKHKPDILLLHHGSAYAKHIEKFEGYELINIVFPYHIYTKKELVQDEYDYSEPDIDMFINNIFFTNIDFKDKKDKESK